MKKCKACDGVGFLTVKKQASLHDVTDLVCQPWKEGDEDKRKCPACDAGPNETLEEYMLPFVDQLHDY